MIGEAPTRIIKGDFWQGEIAVHAFIVVIGLIVNWSEEYLVL